jgi:MFS family permease
MSIAKGQRPMSDPLKAGDDATSRARGRVRWLSRTVLGIGLASLFSDLNHEMVTSLLPAWLASLGAAAGALGIVEGVADGCSSVAKLYGGWLADRLRRRKPLCAVGYGVMALTPLIIGSALHWPFVLAGRSLAWISRGIRTPSRKVLLTEATPPEAYGRAFGLERAMDTCGAILAPLAVLALLEAGLTPRAVIYISFLPALLAMAAITMLVEERGDHAPTERPFFSSFGGFSSPFKRYLAAVGLFGVGDFADTFYILYAVGALTPRFGVASAATFSVAFYALHNVFYAGCSYGGGWLADRVNKRVLLVTGYASAAAAAACMIAGARNLPALAAMFALGGIGVGLYETAEDVAAAGLLERDERGRGFGLMATITGLGDLASSVAFGLLWSVLGVRWAAGIMLIPMLGGAVLIGCGSALGRKPEQSG